MPNVRGGRRGDQIMHCFVRTPKKLTDRQKELFKELAEIEANGVRGVAGARDALLVRLPAGSEAAIERALDDLQEGAVLSLKADTDGNAEVCLSAENVADPDGLVVQLRELGAEVRLDVGLASAVGTGVGASPAAIRRVLATLRAQDIQQIALHTSGESIRAVVPEAQTDAAVRALHPEFIADA